MKKIFAVLLAVLMLGSFLPAFSSAAQITDSGECGPTVTWTLDEDGLLTISGAGEMTDYSYELYGATSPWRASEETMLRVRSLVVENGVSSVGSESFMACGNLESVQIADSVEKIGVHAFSGCSSLRELNLGGGVRRIEGRAFFGCTALNSLTIPDSVTTIGPSAFHGCAGLTELSLGAGLTAIGDSVFYGCSSLKSLAIPAGITAVRPYAFYGCFNLMDVTLPDSLADFGNNVFGGCGKLHILCGKDSPAADYAIQNGVAYGLLDGSDDENTLSGTVEGIRWSINRKTCVLTLTPEGDMPAAPAADLYPWTQAQYKNYVHEAIVSPGAGSIGRIAFAGCDALTQVTVPAGVTSVGAFAFSNCGALTEISLPDSVTMVGPSAFRGCTALSEVSFGAGIQELSAGAFAGCTALRTFMIPNGVTALRDSLFADCVRLTGVVIPSSVTEIGADAFARSCVRDVVLPSGVRSVGSRAFADCESLYSVTFHGTQCSFGQNVMKEGTVIYGHRDSSIEAYATANGMIFREIGGTHEHSFVVIKSVPATCGRTGLNTLACACGAQKYEVLPKTDLHVQGAAVRTLIKAATCVEAGEERITVSCTTCGKTLLDETYEIAATGVHTPGEPTEQILLAPTCVDAGQKLVTTNCAFCGQEIRKQTVEIPATGIHTPGNTVETVQSPATCTQKGVMSISCLCAVCGETVWTSQIDIPMTAHRDDNGDQRCDVCGYAVGKRCSYCGQIHDDSITGKIIQFMHSILYFFRRMFTR